MSTITGRIPQGGAELREYARDAVQKRAFHEFDAAPIEKRLFDHYANTVRRRIAQWWCRHDRLPHFEQDRVTLRCTSCGHDTPGWEIGPR